LRARERKVEEEILGLELQPLPRVHRHREVHGPARERRAHVGRIVELEPEQAQQARHALVADLGALSTLGLRALDALHGGAALELQAGDAALLERASEPCAELRLAVAPPLRRLIGAAATASVR